jgi:hypothetical protein
LNGEDKKAGEVIVGKSFCLFYFFKKFSKFFIFLTEFIYYFEGFFIIIEVFGIDFKEGGNFKGDISKAFMEAEKVVKSELLFKSFFKVCL